MAFLFFTGKKSGLCGSDVAVTQVLCWKTHFCITAIFIWNVSQSWISPSFVLELCFLASPDIWLKNQSVFPWWLTHWLSLIHSSVLNMGILWLHRCQVTVANQIKTCLESYPPKHPQCCGADLGGNQECSCFQLSTQHFQCSNYSSEQNVWLDSLEISGKELNK